MKQQRSIFRARMLALCATLLVCSSLLNAQTWSPVGTSFSGDAGINCSSLAKDPFGRLYLSYSDDNNTYAFTFSGGSWVPVGSGVVYGIDAATSTHPGRNASIVTDATGRPYVVLIDYGPSLAVKVLTYTAGSWQVLGGTAVSAAGGSDPGIAIGPGNVPYVVYNDYTTNAVLVKKYNSGSSLWEQVGAAVTNNWSDANDIAINSVGVPYVVCRSAYYNSMVKEFSGGTWNDVGSGLTNGANQSIAIDGNDVPYISYSYNIYGYNNTAVAKLVSGTWNMIYGNFASHGTPGANTMAVTADGTVYAISPDPDNGNKALVVKSGGAVWAPAGNSGFSLGAIQNYSSSIVTDATGAVYVAYTDAGNSNRLSVMALQNNLPSAISGAGLVCTGGQLMLSNTVSGGTWSSSNTAIATVHETNGTVYGVTPGNVVVTYATSGGSSTVSLLVKAAPTGSIAGGSCTGSLLTLTTNPGFDNVTWKRGSTSVQTTTANPAPTIVSISNNDVGGSVVTQSGTFVTPSGDLYVTDWINNTVYKYPAGFNASTPGIVVAKAGLQYARGVAVDASGNVYVTQQFAIKKFSVGSDASTPAVFTIGTTSYDGGDICLDAAGNIFVSDYSANKICKYAPGSTVPVVVITGVTATGLFVDNDTIYVADQSDQSVKKFAPVMLNTYDAGTIVAGGNGGGSGANQFYYPSGVFVDNSGNIYVTDQRNHRVQKFPRGSTSASNGITVAGTGSSGVGATELYNPFHTHVDADGNMYIGDLDNNRVQVYYKGQITSDTYTASDAGSYNVVIASPNGCSATSNTITVNQSPGAIAGRNAVCLNGTIVLSNATAGGAWTSMSPAVASISASGIVTPGMAGTTVINYSVSGCTTTTTITVNELPAATVTQGPCPGTALTMNSTQAFSTTVWKESGTTVKTTIADAPPTVDSRNYTSDGIAPKGVFVTANGDMYVVDGMGARVYKYPAGSTIGTLVAKNGLMFPSSVFVDGDGNIYVASGGDKIIKYPSTSDGSTTGVVVAQNGLNNVGDVWVDATGNIFVANGNLLRILLYPAGSDASTTPVELPADITDGTYGLYLYNNDVYVSDYSASSIKKYAYQGSFGSYASATIVAGGNGQGLAANQLNLPRGVFVDASGLYVADMNNNRIQKFPLGSTSATNGVTVAGQDGQGNGTLQLSHPFDVHVGATGKIYVADFNNFRVQIYGTGTSVTTTDAYTAGGPGHYSATVTSVAGCTASSNTVTVGSLEVSASGNATICNGVSTPLTASGADTYSWTPVESLSSATGASVMATPTVTTVYTVTGTNSCFSATQTVTITVTPSPGIITGISSVCMGASTTLSNSVSGGTWASTNASIATVDPLSGTVYGVHTGIVAIRYSNGCGADATQAVTVKEPPVPFGAAIAMCTGTTLTLSNAVAGGVWSYSGASVATIDPSGTVYPVGAGSTNFNYSTGCGADRKQAVDIVVASSIFTVTGGGSFCLGGAGVAVGLSGSTAGVVYTLSANGYPASILPGTGSSLDFGNQVITGSYTVEANAGESCSATMTGSATVSLIPAPTAFTVTGGGFYCAGGSGVSIGLNGSTPGIAYTLYANGSPVAVLPGTGSPLDFGNQVMAGNYTVEAETGGGCSASMTGSATVTINPPVPSIAGNTTVTVGGTTTLSNSAIGGVWSSSSTTNATIDAFTGVVTGVAPGIAIITYQTFAGCTATTFVTVNSAAPAGSMVCAGQTVTLNNGGVPGGNWISANGSIATVGATSGIATGVNAGTVLMYYTQPSGTIVTTSLTVKPLNSITLATSICQGQVANASNSTFGGGVWSSGDPGIATVSASGVVSGAGGGIATIIFTTPGGCVATRTISVKPSAAISGTASVCAGQQVVLSTNMPGGNWLINNASLATVTAAGVVKGLAAGAAVVTYIPTNTCWSTKSITVNALSATTGLSSVCQGQSIALTNTTPGGGAWSSSNTNVATISASGVVTGASAGAAIITFATAVGCESTKTVAVTASASLSGIPMVCTGQTTVLSNSIGGGTWSSNLPSTASVSSLGIVTGGSAGTARISYNMPGGCPATMNVVVNALSPITGATGVCIGQSATMVNTTAGGGVWSSSNSTAATVTAGGVVTGAGSGSTQISFTANNGCIATKSLTVSASPVIGGIPAVCVGQTSQLSSNGVVGTWSSNNASIANISGSGLVTGMGAGATNISYNMPGGCSAGVTVTVSSLQPTTGGSAVCQGQTLTLGNSTAGGGAWTSSNTSVATVSASGVVTGTGGGSATISFTAAGGCVATKAVTVNGTGTISGTLTVCQGQTTTLSSSLPGGNWNSANGSIANISAAGVVMGVGVGTTNMIYLVPPANCFATVAVTVSALLPTSGGTSGMCSNNVMLLANNTPGGGAWSSSNTTIATVNATGTVRSLMPGTVVVSFAAANGCVATRNVIVNSCRENGSPEGSVITEDKISQDVQLFPNPNTGIFTLTGSLGTTSSEATVEVVNMLGQVIYEGKIKLDNGNLDHHMQLSDNIANGSYLLRLRSDENTAVIRFVVGK